MITDSQLLAQVPDFISLGCFMKASAALENGDRYIYIEASNEDVDHAGEVVSQDALRDQRDFFLRHGNIDLSHYTIMGPKAGIANYLDYEVGKPIDVQFVGKTTLVKAQLYKGTAKGSSAMSRNADTVWESMTKQTPPARWYASVGGSVLAKEIRINTETGARYVLVTKVRWNNLALDRCPVNRTVPEISLAPIGIFAKSLGGFVFRKTLEAGYGTDSATLVGGAALRTQSLQGGVMSYEDFIERMRDVCLRLEWKDARSLAALAANRLNLSSKVANDWVSRFLRDLENNRS